MFKGKNHAPAADWANNPQFLMFNERNYGELNKLMDSGRLKNIKLNIYKNSIVFLASYRRACIGVKAKSIPALVEGIEEKMRYKDKLIEMHHRQRLERKKFVN